MALSVVRWRNCNSGETRRGVDFNLVTAVRTSVVVGFTWLLAWFTRQPKTSRLFNGKTWLHLGLSGISTGLAWLCYFQALSVGPPSRVAPFDELSVALVIVSGALLFGEGLP